MIEIIKNNISWLKDFFTLILTGTGAVVTILTYQRAKATILQPIRSEVVKKQTELLSELLQLLFANDQSFETGLDYVEICKVNTLLLLNDYGFTDKFKAERLQEAKTNLQGAVFTKNKLENFHRIQPFGEGPIHAESQEKIKEKLENGKVRIILIQTTKKNREFTAKLDYFRSHPFMPTSIQETLESLNKDITYNLSTALTEELEKFINELPKQIKINSQVKVNLSGISNNFIHARRSHKEQVETLTRNIRNHLRIDEKWLA
ncbi:hypothetical protein [Mucilaginibacter rubeus]|uniref:Uncharacterized protein n=1 Tax=Mucilaginibacter rubeus TaxID=2027860 RepID=A0A5C1I308_9SPHI|nr:hypothetical protein [Mucilaginibacter rubeus]QEM12597.1 hypothetical protein DEO27_022140 [Mucilaginibacter rubeus]